MGVIRNHPLLPARVPVHGLVIDPHTGALELVVDGYKELQQTAENALPAVTSVPTAAAGAGAKAAVQQPAKASPHPVAAGRAPGSRRPSAFPAEGGRNRLLDVTMQGMYTMG